MNNVRCYRILFIGLVLLAMLAATGCIFDNPSKEMIGAWISDTTIDGDSLTIIVNEGNGFCFLGAFAYSFNVQATWNGHTYILAAAKDDTSATSISAIKTHCAGATAEDPDLCVWYGEKDDSWDAKDNLMALIHCVANAETGAYDIKDFDLMGNLGNDGKLHATHVTLENTAKIDSTNSALPAELTFTKQE